jgi:hypothetical protein
VGKEIFIFDLRRTFYGAAMLQMWRPFFSPEFIHDGVVSHRRAYSLAELRYLVREAGIDAEVQPFLPAGARIETLGRA